MEGRIIMLPTQTGTLHLRFAGHSEDISLAIMGLRPEANDDEIRTKLASRLSCSVATLEDYVIVREQQTIIVRPLAIYG